MPISIMAALAIAALSGPRPHHAHNVTVVAKEYKLELPPKLEAGPTTFRVHDEGQQAHHLTLVRLDGGHTLSELVAAFKAGGPPPRWAVFVGGANTPDPGQTSLPVTVDLEPGTYAALCMIPGPDGVPHVIKGMSATVTVTGKPEGDMPVATDTASLTDYAFTFTRPLDAHTRTLLVRNNGAQPHELVITKLAPGKSAPDVAAWAEHMQGPPPAHFLGGVSPLGPGESNVLHLDLTPGRYAVLCFLPDAKDGKPHVAHGMMQNLTIER